MAKRASRDGSRTKSTKKATAKKGKPPRRVIVAAGAVLWRPDADTGEPLIAVIHRPRYDDWSLPKGKVDPGENEPVAAVREIWEETGQRSQLGRRLIQTTIRSRRAPRSFTTGRLGRSAASSPPATKSTGWSGSQSTTPRHDSPTPMTGKCSAFAEQPADTRRC